MECDTYLFSVKPAMAEALVSGRKKYEFRRARPALKPGSLVYVYAVSPVRAIVGSFQAGEVTEGEPNDVWRRLQSEAGTPRDIFFSYFRDRDLCFAVSVRCPVEWRASLELDTIRELLGGFQPPRSYRRVTERALLDVICRHLDVNDACEGRRELFAEGSTIS